MLIVAAETPRQPDVLRLLAAADAESAARYPAESRYGVGIDALEQPGCRFLVAREDGAALGCGAVVLDGGASAEIKRIFVADHARCRGVARRIIAALEEIARAEGAGLLRLETGVASHAALALYRRIGFRDCDRFGGYRPDPLSVFMEKSL